MVRCRGVGDVYKVQDGWSCLFGVFRGFGVRGRIAGVNCSVFFRGLEVRVGLLGSFVPCFSRFRSAGSDCWGQLFGVL